MSLKTAMVINSTSEFKAWARRLGICQADRAPRDLAHADRPLCCADNIASILAPFHEFSVLLRSGLDSRVHVASPWHKSALRDVRSRRWVAIRRRRTVSSLPLLV